MKNIRITFLLIFAILLHSCKRNKTASEIIQKTIKSIDTIETIYYKQDMIRTNPGKVNDSIFRYREMYFKRLVSDSVVGVKGHWYMYADDTINVIFEDIYDGNRLIRKNNRDSAVMIYDLSEYPEFKRNHFWGHNTSYGMQHEFRFILNNMNSYTLERLNDTTFMDKSCFQILIRLENKMTMPGFAIRLEDSDGSISETLFLIDKKTCYPVRIKGESYSIKNPELRYFIDQRYYDVEFNPEINENVQFNTSAETVKGFEITEMKPY